MRSETSVFMISDGDVNGISTVNFGLQIENVKKRKKKLSNFENDFSANFYLL